MRLALYQPDIPQNTGTMIRLGACMDVPVDVIEPCGFPFSVNALKRAGMDYLDQADMKRHDSWQAFNAWRKGLGMPLVLLSTKAGVNYVDHEFGGNSILLVGRESAGVPAEVHEAVDASVRVPMVAGMRSLNVAVAAAMVLGEALRQSGGFAGSARS